MRRSTRSERPACWPIRALVLEAWDVNRLGVGQRRFGVEQEVKLWGKYGLERNIAQADADAAKFQGRATVTELIAQVVAAHGEYNAAYEAVGISTRNQTAI